MSLSLCFMLSLTFMSCTYFPFMGYVCEGIGFLFGAFKNKPTLWRGKGLKSASAGKSTPESSPFTFLNPQNDNSNSKYEI